MKVVELLGDEEAFMTADYYGVDLSSSRMDDIVLCDDFECEFVVKCVKFVLSDVCVD